MKHHFFRTKFATSTHICQIIVNHNDSFQNSPKCLMDWLFFVTGLFLQLGPPAWSTRVLPGMTSDAKPQGMWRTAAEKRGNTESQTAGEESDGKSSESKPVESVESQFNVGKLGSLTISKVEIYAPNICPHAKSPRLWPQDHSEAPGSLSQDGKQWKKICNPGISLHVC